MRIYKPIALCALASIFLTEPLSVSAAMPTTEAQTVVTSTSTTVFDSNGDVIEAISAISKENVSNKSMASTKAVKFKDRQPKITKVEKSSKDSKTVYWSEVKGCTGYQIKFSVDKKFRKAYEPTTVILGPNEGRAIECIKLKKNKNYYFKVRAYKTNKKTGKKSYSKWSKVKLIKR